jgi:polyhydroxyalkanoate synthesis repressor PhaR
MVTPARKTTRKSAVKKETVSPSQTNPSPSTDKLDTQRVIKKYPNRRLYDTQHSSYITLFDIKDLVMANEPFIVVDAKTGEELTRNVLMQIILEEESGGHPLFSTQSLMLMIRFYGNSLQGLMAPFMEQNLNQFIDLQNQYIAHCQKMGRLSSSETWLSFMNAKASGDLLNPMNFMMNAGTQFWEQMQQQSPNLMSGFPFKTFKQ